MGHGTSENSLQNSTGRREKKRGKNQSRWGKLKKKREERKKEKGRNCKKKRRISSFTRGAGRRRFGEETANPGPKQQKKSRAP